MLKRTVWLAALLAASGAAAAEDMTYADCTAMVDRDARAAEQKAAAWQTHGGGMAAMHCHAMALYALKRYGEAARVLDALGRNRDIPAADRAALFDEAGQAWLFAGKTQDAVQSFSAALTAQPNAVSYLADRARARAMLKDWKGADADLGAALVQDQNRADLLVLRSSARWALGDRKGAAIDIVRALEIYPDYPPALLERGKMKYFAGDANGARRDWKTAAATGQGETVAEAKRLLTEAGAAETPLSVK
jgi:tetratricopeptide (TPR) repeat protein